MCNEKRVTLAELVISGGTIISPEGELRADIAIDAEGKVEAIGTGLTADRTLDASGCYVSSGLVDLHAHLRQPGGEPAETIRSGARAAVAGGFTAILAMPNTTPVVDNAAAVREILSLQGEALCDVYPTGSITVGRQGTQLAPLAEMAELGVCLFTDDGSGVADNNLMRRALEYASGLGVTLAQHCRDEALSASGVMHEGEWSSRLGLAGQPSEAEELMVMRDIALARLTGGRVHLQNLSSARSVELVRLAKAEGLAITAEVTPHHLSFTDAACSTYDPVFKVDPPLRSEADRAALHRGLGDGTIDAIATAHAPHTPDRKDVPFDMAPSGVLGLETALGVALTYLDEGIATILRALSWRPAEIAGISDRHGANLGLGRAANLCVIDPHEKWTVDYNKMQSRSRNSPFHGIELRGRVRHTLVDGEVVYLGGEVQQ